jgi:hypothetical protein
MEFWVKLVLLALVQLCFSSCDQTTLARKSGVAMRKPDAAISKPGAAMRKPDAAISKPGAAMRKPDAAMRKPDAAISKPDGTYLNFTDDPNFVGC